MNLSAKPKYSLLFGKQYSVSDPQNTAIAKEMRLGVFIIFLKRVIIPRQKKIFKKYQSSRKKTVWVEDLYFSVHLCTF